MLEVIVETHEQLLRIPWQRVSSRRRSWRLRRRGSCLGCLLGLGSRGRLYPLYLRLVVLRLLG